MRPLRVYAAGVLFGLKRGATLSDGSVIIPVVPTVAALLPQLRSQHANSAAKQLQSSSHRGLCSLHRAVATLAALPLNVSSWRVSLASTDVRRCPDGHKANETAAASVAAGVAGVGDADWLENLGGNMADERARPAGGHVASTLELGDPLVGAFPWES